MKFKRQKIQKNIDHFLARYRNLKLYSFLNISLTELAQNGNFPMQRLIIEYTYIKTFKLHLPNQSDPAKAVTYSTSQVATIFTLRSAHMPMKPREQNNAGDGIDLTVNNNYCVLDVRY